MKRIAVRDRRVQFERAMKQAEDFFEREHDSHACLTTLKINMELFRINIIKIQQDSLYIISRKNTQGVPEKLVNILQSGY